MNKKYLRLIYIFSSLGLLIGLSSCNDDPVFQTLIQETGNLLVANSDSVELVLNYGSEYVELDKGSGLSAFLLGSAQGIEAMTIQEFAVPDSLSFITDSDIISSKIYFYHDDYAWGDLENPKLEFTVNALEDDVFNYNKWEDINPSAISDMPSAGFSSDVEFFSLEGSASISIVDSLDFDKAIIARWMQIRGDTESSSFTDQDKVNAYSIAIKSGDESNVISRFSSKAFRVDDTIPISESRRTKIKVVYTIFVLDTIVEEDTTKIEIKIDTNTVWLNSIFNKTLFNAPQTEKKSLTIQAGATSRAHLFFNLNNHVPKHAGIVSAELRLTLDTENSKFSSKGQDSILSADLLGKVDERPAIWDFKGYRESNTDIYAFRKLAGAFDRWASRDNYGRIYFSWQKDFLDYNELINLDRYVFYGPNAEDKNKRPKLIIVYYEREGLDK